MMQERDLAHLDWLASTVSRAIYEYIKKMSWMDVVYGWLNTVRKDRKKLERKEQEITYIF